MDATNAVNPSENNATAETEAALDAAAIVAARSYDEPYRYGRQPTTRAPFPFTEREFARLLVVRGRLHAEQSTFNPAEA